MPYVNLQILMGNVGQEPRIAHFEDGGCIAECTLATTKRGYTTKGGKEIPERTTWHNLKFRDRQAEFVEKYVHTGVCIYVQGETEKRKYTGKDGVERETTEIMVANVELVSVPSSAAKSPVEGQESGNTAIFGDPKVKRLQQEFDLTDTDDLPF